MIRTRPFARSGAAAALATILMLSAAGARAELSEPAPNCAGLQYRQMDFWLGSWDVTWVGTDGTVGKGSSEVTAALGGCAVQERFSGGASLPLRGMSLSNYHRQKKEWRQLWLDNEGGYLAFTGGPKGKDFVMTLNNPEEANRYRRMVWTNIAPQSLDLLWQESEDEGKTWEKVLTFRYVRKDR